MLQVAAVLRVVDPQLRTLLIAGFDATDLWIHATQLPGCRYLRKPFRDQTLLREVTEVLLAPPLPCLSPAIAGVEIEATGRICAANTAARALFAMTVEKTSLERVLEECAQNLPPSA